MLRCEKYKSAIEGIITSGYFLEDENVCPSLIGHSELTARIFKEGLKTKISTTESEYLEQVTLDENRGFLAHWVNYETDKTEVYPFFVQLDSNQEDK